MMPPDLAAGWEIVTTVVLGYLVYLAAGAITVLLGLGIFIVLRRAVSRVVATVAPFGRGSLMGGSHVPPERHALSVIEHERFAGEARIDTLAWAFDQQIAQIVHRRRSLDDVGNQRQDPGNPVHP